MHRHKLFTDGALLYFAHIFRYVFPIVIIPLLARKLGAEHYGIVLVGLSLATLVSLIVEFGFNVSGTRDLATQDASQLDGVVSAILTAKLILMVPAITFGVAVVSSSTVLQNAPVVGVLSIIYGLLQGTNLLWYFRARGRMALVVKIELAAQLLNMVLIVTFVGGENSYASVILFYILASALTLLITGVILVREVKVRISSWAAARNALRGGGAIFVLTGAVAAYTAASGLVLGWLSTPDQVGYFGPADKLINAGLQLLNPLSTLLLPHMTRELKSNPAQAYVLLKRTTFVLTACSSLASVVILFLGPFIMKIFLGHAYAEAGNIFAVLSLTLPLGTISYCLSMLLLLPARKDLSVTVIAIVGGALNLLCAYLLTPQNGAMGMAISRVIAEIAITILTFYVTIRSGLWRDVWSARGVVPQAESLSGRFQVLKRKFLRLPMTFRSGL
ncbi:oligosaccharide flippase family protein [Methylobacterium sp. SI9]|uniref:oligosaccharide flippase family protein n=1 Tax=Methylobacterium guangdongense TaxID=3138811 RepID=UPI00313D5A53